MKNINKYGSSETKREILINLQKQKKNDNLKNRKYLKFNFENYLKYGKPKQISNPNKDFLEWFLGFFEAEGSFSHWFDGKKYCLQIEITQKDPKLMYKIKKNLGFGNVTQFLRNNKIYWRYSTSKKECLISFIYLFNGNFITVHKNSMLSNFIKNFNKIYNNSIIIIKPQIQLSLKSYWLSGFLEGDGGFWAKKRKRKNQKKLNTGLIIKFYVTQKNELLLLNAIKMVFKIPSNIYQIHNGHTPDKYNRLETCNLENLKSIKTYLEMYPFLGQRNILIKQWIRLIDYKINDYPLTLKSSKKLTRLILSTKK